MKAIEVKNLEGVRLPTGGAFKIRRLEEIIEFGDLQESLHRHDFYFLLFVHSGSGEHIIDFTSYQITDQSVFLLRPGQVHQLRVDQKSKGFIVQFDLAYFMALGSQFTRLLHTVSHVNKCGLTDDSFTRLQDLLNSVLYEYESLGDRFKDAINALMYVFFIELGRNRKGTNQGKTSGYDEERCFELMNLLETHVHQVKQVSAYAEMMNLSVFQLNRILKETIGKTCSELINEQIVLESKRYLLSTANQVKDIAHLLGYEDVSYFIRFFRKNSGHSPEAFREKFR